MWAVWREQTQVGKVFREIVITLVMAIVIFLLLQATVQSFIIVGSSMQPNFQDGERVLINKVVYRFDQPERGDVIIFHPGGDQESDYIKRIIGLPGEFVEIKDGVVCIHEEDGDVFTLAEPYIAEAARRDFTGSTIPEDEYFVLGDNRNNSNDSRNSSVGTIPKEDIIGKAWLLIWPPGEWGFIARYQLEQLASSAE
jgi:signal peptidase I